VIISRSIKYFIFGFLLATVLSFLASSLYFWHWLNTPVEIPDSSRIYVIEEGEGLHKLSTKLNGQGLLDWPKVWVAYAKYSGSTQVNLGEFLLSENESPVSLFEKFQSTDFVQYQVTLIEGATAGQTVEKLSKAKNLSQELDEEEWTGRAENLPYTSSYEALIMASIIEKETGAPHERAQIAGVFVRRLEQGMRLQTDPTVIYGLEREWDGNITRADLKTSHPYNTYLIKGLPPTPIAIVGRDAINAALHPEEGSALYFVAKGDGTHYFSDTFEEHKNAVKRYQLKRKEGYRSQYQP